MTNNTTLVPAMQLALDANFGSLALWASDMQARAASLAAHGGQVRLCFQPLNGRLVNRTLAQTSDHPVAQTIDHSADSEPLLTLEVQAQQAVDLPAWWAQIDWAAPYAAYQHAVHAASHALTGSAADAAHSLLLDVRRAGVFAQAQQQLPGATWRDPALVAQWAAELPKDRPVLVYCIYGHEVGRATALRLHAAGVQARFLEGGIDAWQSAGRPLHTIQRTGNTGNTSNTGISTP